MKLFSYCSHDLKMTIFYRGHARLILPELDSGYTENFITFIVLNLFLLSFVNLTSKIPETFI